METVAEVLARVARLNALQEENRRLREQVGATTALPAGTQPQADADREVARLEEALVIAVQEKHRVQREMLARVRENKRQREAYASLRRMYEVELKKREKK
jgi:hypothetical protein